MSPDERVRPWTATSRGRVNPLSLIMTRFSPVFTDPQVSNVIHYVPLGMGVPTHSRARSATWVRTSTG